MGLALKAGVGEDGTGQASSPSTPSSGRHMGAAVPGTGRHSMQGLHARGGWQLHSRTGWSESGSQTEWIPNSVPVFLGLCCLQAKMWPTEGHTQPGPAGLHPEPGRVKARLQSVCQWPCPRPLLGAGWDPGARSGRAGWGTAPSESKSHPVLTGMPRPSATFFFFLH